LEAEKEPGGDRDARAADAREERERLRGTNDERVGQTQSLEIPVPPPVSLGEPEQGCAHEQQQRDQPEPLAKGSVEEALERGTQQRGGDDADREQPCQASVRFAAHRAFRDRAEPRDEQPPQVPPEVDEQSDQCPEVKHHVERGAVEERVVPAEQPRDDDEVRRRRDGQELGEPLHDSDDDRLNDEWRGLGPRARRGARPPSE
jgi:hypothetical protein